MKVRGFKFIVVFTRYSGHYSPNKLLFRLYCTGTTLWMISSLGTRLDNWWPLPAATVNRFAMGDSWAMTATATRKPAGPVFINDKLTMMHC